jgi:hypothetical protein
MANPWHLQLFEQGVKPWNEWQRRHPLALNHGVDTSVRDNLEGDAL